MNDPQSLGLELQERVGETAITVELGGELDISTADRLQDTVARLCVAEGRSDLVIDLSGLAFIDSSGLAAMVYASRLCERYGCRLSVIRGPESVHEVFELTGLTELLPFSADDDGRAPS
jgi:anti-sigma B factor antagonist